VLLTCWVCTICMVCLRRFTFAIIFWNSGFKQRRKKMLSTVPFSHPRFILQLFFDSPNQAVQILLPLHYSRKLSLKSFEFFSTDSFANWKENVDGFL